MYQPPATGVRVKIVEGEMDIYSIYIPPGDELPAEQLEELLQTPIILPGDFNIKHENWNSRTSNTKGKRLLKEQTAIAIRSSEY